MVPGGHGRLHGGRRAGGAGMQHRPLRQHREQQSTSRYGRGRRRRRRRRSGVNTTTRWRWTSTGMKKRSVPRSRGTAGALPAPELPEGPAPLLEETSDSLEKVEQGTGTRSSASAGRTAGATKPKSPSSRESVAPTRMGEAVRRAAPRTNRAVAKLQGRS